MALTPKEKAVELVEKFKIPNQQRSETYFISHEIAKAYALICVDEILSQFGEIEKEDWLWEEFAVRKNTISK